MFIRDYKKSEQFQAMFIQHFKEQVPDGAAIRIYRDDKPRPFSLILLPPESIYYMSVFTIGAASLPIMEGTRMVERKCIPDADVNNEGSGAGFLIHFNSETVDEIWYLPGRAFRRYLLENPVAATIPLAYIRRSGVELPTERRTPRCRRKDVYDIPTFLKNAAETAMGIATPTAARETEEAFTVAPSKS